MSLSAKERTTLVAMSIQDPVFFCKTFLGDLFSRPVPWVHRGLFAILMQKTGFLLKYGELDKIVRNFVYTPKDGESRQIFRVYKDGARLESEEIRELDRSLGNLTGVEIKLDLGQFTLILMPRGSSKTTIAGLAVPLMKVLFMDDKFTLYVSKADKHAEAQLESIKRHLAINEKLLECFGQQKPERSDEERWAANKFETTTGVAMASRGKGSQIRGVNHMNQRPTTILIDDPQDRKDVLSDTTRENDKKWAFSELTPARAQLSGEEGTIVALGTKIHRECLVNVWARDPRWTVVQLGSFDSDGDPIWADYMSREKYNREKEAYQREGLLSLFHMEYDNQEVTVEDQVFPHSFFIYEPATDIIATATYCDPAISEKRTADFTAIVTVGMSSKGVIYVLDCWLERTGSDEKKMDEFFRQIMVNQCQFAGFESNGYQAAFGNTVREHMFRRGYYFELQSVTHKTQKVQRIRGGLRPRYANGFMRHTRKFIELETQLEDFRMDNSHVHDDGPDALAAAVALMDPAAALAAGHDINEDYYKEDIDDTLGDWRFAS